MNTSMDDRELWISTATVRERPIRSSAAPNKAGGLGQPSIHLKAVGLPLGRVQWTMVAGIFALLVTAGCVRRTIKITTDPPKALVFLNDQELGHSEVSTDFLWYGDYDVIIRHPGYKTLKTHWLIKAPWYQWIPLDFFAEVLWPGHLHDVRTNHFVMEPEEPCTPEQLLERASTTRAHAFQPNL